MDTEDSFFLVQVFGTWKCFNPIQLFRRKICVEHYFSPLMPLKGKVPFLEVVGLCVPNQSHGNFMLIHADPARRNSPSVR